jgi:hypothetical protein
MSLYRCRGIFKKHSNVSPTLSQHRQSTLTMHGRHQHVAPKYIVPTPGHRLRHPPPPTNHWHPLVQRKGHRQHYACDPRDIGSSPNTRHCAHNGCGHPTSQLSSTHPDAAVSFHMRLYIHSDASRLSEPQARSRVGGYFCLGMDTEPPDIQNPYGPIQVESRIMKKVMAAASEAEIGALPQWPGRSIHPENSFCRWPEGLRCVVLLFSKFLRM